MKNIVILTLPVFKYFQYLSMIESNVHLLDFCFSALEIHKILNVKLRRLRKPWHDMCMHGMLTWNGPYATISYKNARCLYVRAIHLSQGRKFSSRAVPALLALSR